MAFLPTTGDEVDNGQNVRYHQNSRPSTPPEQFLEVTGTGGSEGGARLGAAVVSSSGESPLTEPDRSRRPAIVTVDDDPSVSRAVARDLRREYGADHRIVRGESGEQTLEALRELKLRGEQVAVMLADYRMPQMNGIEFLEQAMDIFPFARRVLLTAYADTDAAISAINLVDVDHYLLKPWDPPEEKLYPVVTQLLQEWRSSPHEPVPDTKVVGDRWSSRSFEVRDFLARNRVPFRWYASTEPEGRRLLAAAEVPPEDHAASIPVVVTAQGEVLRCPTDADLASRVGLTTDPAEDFYDVIVVGGGPAGLGAAVYAASEGLRTVLVERTATGGQAGTSARIENYLGFPDGISGSQLAERARRQAVRFGAEVISARDVSSVESDGAARVVRFVDGGTIAAHTTILATGVAYRQLEAPGAEALTGRGVFYGAALTEAVSCADQDVYVVGGANSAGQAALHFARRSRSVTMVVRGSSLRTSMSSYLVDQIEATPTITVRTGASVVEAHGTDHLEGLTLLDAASGDKESVATQWLFIFIGAQPRTEWLDESVMRDARGFVFAGPDLMVDGQRPPGWTLDRDPYHLETSVPGVFVAGDVRADSVKRVASAVGEGAMAVMLVHRYLQHL
jgi:thioredoxin reductase (NADPH)